MAQPGPPVDGTRAATERHRASCRGRPARQISPHHPAWRRNGYGPEAGTDPLAFHRRRDAGVVPRLLDVGHRPARPAGRAGRTQARASPHPVRDVRAGAHARSRRTRSARRWSATCWASTTPTATLRSTTRSCAWSRTSRCAIRSSTGRATSAPSTATTPRPTATPRPASRRWPCELLDDIQKETVALQPNFDDRLAGAAVLPARFPNLLVNGSSGIAVGMSTNVPPHNLREIAAGVKQLVIDPDCTVDDLMRHIPGPDFPTGGFVVGLEGIRDMYTTGRGRVIMRARVVKEALRGGKEQLVVTELPYAVSKSKIIEQIAELARRGKAEDDLRHPRRDRPRRHPSRHRAEARRQGRQGAQPALPTHQPAVDVRRHHAGAGPRPAPGVQPQGDARALPRPPPGGHPASGAATTWRRPRPSATSSRGSWWRSTTSTR